MLFDTEFPIAMKSIIHWAGKTQFITSLGIGFLLLQYLLVIFEGIAIIYRYPPYAAARALGVECVPRFRAFFKRR